MGVFHLITVLVFNLIYSPITPLSKLNQEQNGVIRASLLKSELQRFRLRLAVLLKGKNQMFCSWVNRAKPENKNEAIFFLPNRDLHSSLFSGMSWHCVRES